MNERFKEDYGTLRRSSKPFGIANVGKGSGRQKPNFEAARENAGTQLSVSLNKLRESLIFAIKSDILPACQDAIVRTKGVNDNTNPLVLRATRIAQMAISAVPAAEILGYINSQPLSVSRKASLLEAAAQRIGIGWECDSINFVDVTVAVGRLQGVFRRLINQTATAVPRSKGGSVLITTAPGEEHVFGLLFVEELYRSAGWATTLASPKNASEWAKRANSAYFDTICISWSGARHAEPLADALKRRKTKGRTTVIAGGLAALENSEWLENQGVDLVSNSPKAALDFSRRSLLNRTYIDRDEVVSLGG